MKGDGAGAVEAVEARRRGRDGEGVVEERRRLHRQHLDQTPRPGATCRPRRARPCPRRRPAPCPPRRSRTRRRPAPRPRPRPPPHPPPAFAVAALDLRAHAAERFDATTKTQWTARFAVILPHRGELCSAVVFRFVHALKSSPACLGDSSTLHLGNGFI